jgi:hypothetical protein
MRKKIIGFILVIMLLLIIPVTKSAFEYSSINEENILEVTVKVFGRWRIYIIFTIIKNIGDEKVKFVHGSPGGGYEIHNSEKRVYWTPKYPLRIGIGKTLHPGQSSIMFWDFWHGFDDFGRILPKGDYFVKGYVGTNEFGILYSEPVDIFLGRPLNN